MITLMTTIILIATIVTIIFAVTVYIISRRKRRKNMRSPGITVLPFLENGAEAFARVRMDKNIKPPDAIQLATAAIAGCDLFLTNDDRLTRVALPGIHFVTSFDKAPF